MSKNEEFSYFYHYIRQPKLEGRPNRQDPIGPDDLLNLKIALELDKDVLDFLEDHHIFNQ